LVVATKAVGLVDHRCVHHLLDRIALICNALRIKPVEARYGKRANAGVAREPL
jgi:hypothetical protein